MRTPGISGIGNFRLPGLAPAPGRRPPQPGCFGLGAIAATKILFQLIKFQVYGQADNSSMTIVCGGAVSDCGNLIKTTRLAVPSPAVDVLSEASIGKGSADVEQARWKGRPLAFEAAAT